jgi:hypothetical protein
VFSESKTMATLSKNGLEVGRVEYLDHVVSIRSNGNVLRNNGFGWKRWRKVKGGLLPEHALARRQELMAKRCEACPNYAQQRKVLLRFGLEKRQRIIAALDTLGDDIDGVWATLDDCGVKMSFEAVRELSNCRKLGTLELVAYNAQQKNSQN